MNDYFDPDGRDLAIIQTQTSMVVQLAQAELNQAVTTARAFPRSIKRAVDSIISLATLDAETAAECIYALPRGGKPIKGPSVRFAEIVAAMYGNCHVGSRIVAVDRVEKVVIAEGVFLDLETGLKRVSQVHRRISDKGGKLFNDDMIAVTGNAAASIAMREAVLKGVPKAIWRRAYEAADKVTLGTAETLSVRRDKAIKAFAGFGVTPDQIFASLEVGGLDDIGLEEISILTAMFKSIKSEEAKVETYFPAKVDPLAARQAARGTARAALEKDRIAAPEAKAADQTPDESITEDGEVVDQGQTDKERQKYAAEANRADDAATAERRAKRDAAKAAKAAKSEKAAAEAQAWLPLDDAPALDDMADHPKWGATIKRMRADYGDGEEAVFDMWTTELDQIKADDADLFQALMKELSALPKPE